MQKNPVFQWQSQIRFHQADPAGWMFFGRAFEIAHDCCEDLVHHLGFEWSEWFQNPEHAMPIRAAEAEYRRALSAGTHFNVQARVLRLGNSSVTFGFDFYQGNELCLELKSTHVHLNTQTHKSEAWPESFHKKLSAFAAPSQENEP